MITILDVFPDDDSSTQITQLDGREYVLRFYWDDRQDAFFLNIGDQSESPIANRIRMVLSAFPEQLLRRFPDPRLPPGALVLVDMSGQGKEITDRDDFGTRVLLIYISADDDLLTVYGGKVAA